MMWLPRNDKYYLSDWFAITKSTWHLKIRCDIILNYKKTCHGVATPTGTDTNGVISMDNDPHVDNNIKLSPNQQEKLGYLYIHTRLDTNEVFYVGISRVDKGKYKRSKDKRQRNNKSQNSAKRKGQAGKDSGVFWRGSCRLVEMWPMW